MSNKVIFKKPWKGVLIYDICCFSGEYQVRMMEFDAGDVTICDKIERGEKRKGGRLLTLYYNNNTLHWNRIIDVPEGIVEIKDE